jgi:hypothetical protein
MISPSRIAVQSSVENPDLAEHSRDFSIISAALCVSAVKDICVLYRNTTPAIDTNDVPTGSAGHTAYPAGSPRVSPSSRSIK